MHTSGFLLAAAALASSRAVAADAPAGSPMSGFLAELLLVGFLALAGWGLVWAVRRRQRKPGGDVAWVRVVSATSLGVRERAIVIEIKGRLLLVGVTPQQVTLLKDLSDMPSATSEAAPRFADAAAAAADEGAARAGH